ncbi:MAG: esterase [Bryobacterales bacterium]|nr:esterase [Bryobacterales bacterium]
MNRFLILTICACGLFAQQRAARPPQFRSPEVSPDGRITVRFLAPQANEVKLHGEWMAAGENASLEKGESGIWSVTVGPVKPEYYYYSLIVDGIAVIDPKNPALIQGVQDPLSMVSVPGPEADFFAWKDVPHGSVHVHWYESKAVGKGRRIHVYTPPGYEKNTKSKYPVLYLLHGSGDTDREWVEIGKANLILDNLIAGGKAKPMIIVMPDGHAVDPNSTDPSARRQNTAKFEEDLLGDVMPLVESTYRVASGSHNRALAGLSMGGGQTLAIGLTHSERFSFLGVFSAGVGFGSSPEAAKQQFDERYAAALTAPDKLNKQVALFWIGIGKADTGLASAKLLDETLTEHNVKHEFHVSGGAHQWWVWRHYLADFAPLLFRKGS